MLTNIAYIAGALCGGGTLRYGDFYFIRFKTKNHSFAKIISSHLSKLSNKVKIYSEKNSYTVILRDKKTIEQFVKKCDVKFNRYDWRVPFFVKQNSLYMKYFLKGFFDRSCVIYNTIVTSSGRKIHKKLLRCVFVNNSGVEDVKELLIKNNIHATTYTHKNYVYMDIHGRQNIMNFVKNIGFDVPEKKHAVMNLYFDFKNLSEVPHEINE